MFRINKIEKQLHINKIAFFEIIDSTNKLAGEMALKTKKELIVIALEQTDGRGRFDRKWFSPKGGIYFSYGILIGNLGVNTQLIPIVSAMALIELFKNKKFYNINFRWPNDILINNKKISGILLELANDMVIIGIGINVNNELFDPSIADITTSMYNEMKIKYDYEDIIIEIVQNIRRIAKDKEYIKNFLDTNSMISQEVSIDTGDKKYYGIVKGFTDNGEIIINIDGKNVNFIAGDVRFIRNKK